VSPSGSRAARALGRTTPLRFDPLTLLGLCIAFGAVLVAQQLEGGAIATLLHGPAFLIVVGGSLGACLVQTPGPVLLRTLRLSRWLFASPKPETDLAVQALVDWARVARKDGLLALERLLAQQNDPFLFRGLQLLVDGAEPEVIRRTLEIEIDAREGRELEAAAVYESVGGYAPTIGVIGAVLGLIQVLGNLENPSLLGDGIAVAFVATIYGVGLANLVLLPLAGRLRSAIQELSRYQDLLTEGLTAIAEGENPRVVEYRLRGLAH
jgi:chemotaxis protein MotA